MQAKKNVDRHSADGKNACGRADNNSGCAENIRSASGKGSDTNRGWSRSWAGTLRHRITVNVLRGTYLRVSVAFRKWWMP